jgi:Mn-dependent DtxR family transcriptional regulator
LAVKQTIKAFRAKLQIMSDLSEEDRQILDHLRESVARGESYFRSKNIAEQLGLSAKQVGARLPKLDEESEDVEIEKWGRARSTTWRVTLS